MNFLIASFWRTISPVKYRIFYTLYFNEENSRNLLLQLYEWGNTWSTKNFADGIKI